MQWRVQWQTDVVHQPRHVTDGSECVEDALELWGVASYSRWLHTHSTDTQTDPTSTLQATEPASRCGKRTAQTRTWIRTSHQVQHSQPALYTVIHNYENPYEKWNIFVAWPHLWLKLGMVKPESEVWNGAEFIHVTLRYVTLLRNIW